MNINQHFSNLATKAAQDGADASQLISQRERLFKDKVIPELTKRGANDTAIVQAREKWYSQTDKVMQSAGLLPKAGQNSRSFAKDKRADKAVQEAVKTGSNFPIIKEALKSTGETIGNLFGQGVGGMIEGAAGFVRDIGENEKNSTSARIAKYGKNLKKDYENSASTFQKELQGGQHGKIPQLSAGAIQSVPAMALPFGAAKGVATVATKVPILASKAPYLGIVAGKAAEHTQNYGEVRRNATANLERDFPTWEKLQGNPLFEQNFNERLNNGLTITQAREQAYAATLDQLSEKASDKYGTAMTAIGFIAPSGAVLGSGILKNAPTSKIGKALTGGGVDSALVKREMQQVPRTGMAKLVPDMSIAANKAAAKMVGKQALEEGLQGGIGEYGAQAASANIGGTPVDYGKVGQTILEEGLVGGIMGGGMQSATGGSPTSQAKDVAKQLRNQTNTLRQEEAAARKELADAMQLNDPAALQSAQDNLNNIGAEASKVKAAYDQYGIDTPYFVERFAAQYQPPKQQEQEPPVVEPEVQPEVEPEVQPEVQPEVEPQPTEQPQATPINQGMANTTNLVMDSVSNGYITPEEAQVIQTDPIRADVFTLTMTGDEAAAHNVVMNAVSLGNIDTDQAQELIQSITRYSQAKAPKKPTISNIVNNHVKQQIHPQDKGLFSNQVELDPETFEPVDPNQPSPFQEDFNEPKEFYNAAKANDYVRINGLTESHDIESADDGTLIVVKKQGIIPDDPNLNSFGYSPENIVQPTPADPNLSNFSEGPVSVDSLNLENVPDVIDPEEVQQPVESIPKAQPDHNKHKTFTNYVRANDFVKQNGLKESHEIITKGEGQVIVQPKSAEPVEDFGSDQEFDDVLSAVPPIGTPSQDPVEPVQAADPATDFDSDEAFDDLLNAVPPSDKQTDPVQPTDSFADQVRDAHLNNPKAKPKLIQDEINKGRPRAEVLAEVSDIVKAINTITTPELKTDTPEPETPAQTPIEQKTDESGIQKNDAPEGIKSGDIGRGSDGKPFLSKNAANRGLKLRDVEKTHEVVEISPSNFVLRAKETVPGVDKPQESDNPYQKYDDLAKQYGRSIKPDGIIVARNGQDTAFKIQEKNGRLHIKDVLGNLAFSGATTPESLGKFLEDYWYDKKDQSNQKEQAPAENSVLDTPAPEEMKKGDVGRKSDNQPFASATAAKTTIKKQGLDNSHEVVQLAPSQFVLREKAKSEDDSLESGSEELALADLPHPPFQRNDTPGTIKKKDIGRASDNKPFANKSAATTTIKKEGLSDTHEVVQLAPSQFVLREKIDSEQEQNESSISDMNNAKQSIDRTVTLVTHDHFLKGSLGDTQHSKSEIIRSIPNEMMDQVHKLEDIFSDLSSLQADEVKTNVTYNKELLIKLAKLNPDVQVHIVSDLANSSDLIIQSISDQLLEGGFYSIDSRISYIYPRSSEWKGTVSELINHELIHAATQEYIDTDKLTPEQLEHLDEIKETIWSNNRESFDNIDSDVLDRINYAIFTSYPHEMFTVFGAESSPREILSQIGILDRFDTIFNNVLKEAANDNGQIKQRSSGRFNEEGTSERVSGNAFRVPGTISAIRTTTSSSENIERSPSNQPASLSSPEKDEVGQVDDKRKQESNSGSDSPLRSRTKNQKVQGSNPNQVRAELVSRFGGDTIQQLEQKGILSIVPTHTEQGVEGFAENGRVTLVADAITAENIVPVFLHELGGHIGMQGVLKASAYDNLMSEFNRLVKSGNPDAIEAKRLAERESDAQVQADEYLPYLITVAARNQQNQGPAQKLINRVLSAVKAWAVDRLGLNLKLNSSDMVALAERMIKTISKGTPPTPPKMNVPQTETVAFKKWFSDSKVVNADGKPKTVYHGTNQTFNIFNVSDIGIHAGTMDQANSRKAEKNSGEFKIMPLYMRINNPLRLKDSPSWKDPAFYIQKTGIAQHLSAPLVKKITGFYGELKGINLKTVEGQEQALDLAMGINRLVAQELKDQGYDGIVYKNTHDGTSLTNKMKEEDSYIVFDPEQIKSATINNGEFDPNNPDIRKSRRYSRSSTANPQNMSRSKQRELLDKAASTAFGQLSLRGAEASKTLSNRTLNLFQTMLHKSLRDETGQFKKTFDLVQGKINHVTFASSKSMDVAPSILTQLEEGSDYWKEVKRVGRTIGHTFSGGKIDKAKVDKDLDKVGKLMFENTLLDNSERHTVKELKQLGFDDDQIGLYNEIRDAIDTSLDTFANTTFSNIYKHLGGTNEEVLELAGQDLDIVDHYNEILKRIDTLTKGKPEKAEARQAAIEAVDRVFKKANDLKDQGYVPLMRFGKYFVRIWNPTTGEVSYRQHFESESERNIYFRDKEKKGNLPPGTVLEKGQINELQHKLFQGVSPETVALFAKESGLPIGDAETAYIKYAVQNNHALKRLLKRQGIDGFDTDVKRVLASFVMSNARYSANQSYNPAIDESITNIEDPAFQEDAIRLRDYSLDTQEELAAVKNFAFVWYMGFSAMFGVVNLTQPLLQTLPYLMQYSKDHGTILKAFGKAVTTWRKGTDAMDPKYKAHYERARKEGHLDPQNTWMMQGLERGKSGLGASTWQLVSHASGLFAQASETVNRRTSLFAALDVAESMGQAKLEKLGFKDAYDFAVRTIQETQGIYNKGNRPRVSRGNVGSVLMMYKQFMIAYIEQMVRMQKSGLYGGEDDEFKKKMAALVGFGVSRSVLTMLGILMALSGTTGLPFVRDILDGIETAGGLVGKPVNTEREIQIALHDALGQTMGSAVNTALMDGIVNLNPLIDVKGRMGMGDLIPATAYFSPTTSDYMKSSEISQIAGPIGGLLEKVKESVALAQVGAYGQSSVQLLPKAITSVGQGAIAATTGDYRNMKTGVKTNDATVLDGIVKMLDAQPAGIAKEGRIRGLEMKDKSSQIYLNKRWKERYEAALESGDRTQVRDIKQQIRDYNKENPRYPIKFNQKLAETNFNKSNQTWQEKRKTVKGLEWMSEYNPHLKQ
ncbi:PLxRFG domain-containing protein [Acinetobacter sp. GC2]|uniref:PLxRFG domain-containing protein n=1 Tax=Acinetobacter lwoffii TaxID=28090 RepID=UPI0013DECA21|nr:PLxRFG domain-containing protein [Acinetobacter lwoffii]NGP40774.1 PLxRFG domain-containing protein [Acinetobacter lwoffii]